MTRLNDSDKELRAAIKEKIFILSNNLRMDDKFFGEILIKFEDGQAVFIKVSEGFKKGN